MHLLLSTIIIQYNYYNVDISTFFQPLGSLSSNNSRYVYSVPGKSSLIEGAGVSFDDGSEEITAEFTLLQSLVSDTEFHVANLHLPSSLIDTLYTIVGEQCCAAECVCPVSSWI